MGAVKQDLELNAHWTFAVIDAVVETFSNMIGVRPQPGRAIFNANQPIHGDISGIMNLVQEQHDGVLIVTFPKDTIFHILARIYGTQFTDINSSVQQAVGEFTNVIYGGVKTSVNKSGYKFKMALPSVVIGDQHKVVNPSTGTTMVVPFTINGYAFHITIQINTDEASNVKS